MVALRGERDEAKFVLIVIHVSIDFIAPFFHCEGRRDLKNKGRGIYSLLSRLVSTISFAI